MGLSGVLSILFGLMLIARPGVGVLAVTGMIGFYSVFLGVHTLVPSAEVRRLDLESAQPAVPG